MDALGKLGINLGLLIANTVNLLLMIALLGAVAYKPIMRMMKERKERIAAGLNNARKAEEALASAETDKQAILDEARAEAQRIISEARARADEAIGQAKAEARDEAGKIVSQGQADAAQEQAHLLAEMRDQIVSLSIAAANHLVGESLDTRKQKAIVKDFFTAVPAEAKAFSGAIQVVTAVPLTATEQKKFQTELDSEDITFITEPAILGGVIVRSGGQQIDASFANQLGQLRASLS